MSATKMVRIIQTVHVSHNETIERSWHDVLERTIEREIDVDGTVLSSTVVEERVIDAVLDFEEETLSSDKDTEPDEIVEEDFEDDEDSNDGKVY